MAIAVVIVLALGFSVPIFASSQEIRFERELAKRMLQTLSVQVRDNFYDRELSGLNWKELTRFAKSQIENTSSPAEMLNAIHGLVGRLADSHTHFIAPNRTITRRFGFEAMAFGDIVRICRIDKDGPAAAAGLEVGDRLLRINGVNVTRDKLISVMMSVRVFRPVDSMEILYYRENTPAAIVRVTAQITHEPALVYLTNGDGEAGHDISARATDSDDLVGYLRLPTFQTDNSTLLRSITGLRNSRAVIIDLRGNAGGSVEAAQYLVGFFQRQPSILAEMIGRKTSQKLQIQPQRPHLSGPVIVLVDSETASSAEIVARHLQRAARALVLGDRTAGRTRASRIFWNRIGSKLVISYGVQIAIGRIVFPDGEDLERKGVTPDRLCIPSAEDLRRSEDHCLREAFHLARIGQHVRKGSATPESQLSFLLCWRAATINRRELLFTKTGHRRHEQFSLGPLPPPLLHGLNQQTGNVVSEHTSRMSLRIHVDAYSGYTANERPLRFALGP